MHQENGVRDQLCIGIVGIDDRNIPDHIIRRCKSEDILKRLLFYALKVPLQESNIRKLIADINFIFNREIQIIVIPLNRCVPLECAHPDKQTANRFTTPFGYLHTPEPLFYRHLYRARPFTQFLKYASGNVHHGSHLIDDITVACCNNHVAVLQIEIDML